MVGKEMIHFIESDLLPQRYNEIHGYIKPRVVRLGRGVYNHGVTLLTWPFYKQHIFHKSLIQFASYVANKNIPLKPLMS